MNIGKVSTVLFARGVLEFTRQCWLMSDEKVAHETAEKYLSNTYEIVLFAFRLWCFKRNFNVH